MNTHIHPLPPTHVTHIHKHPLRPDPPTHITHTPKPVPQNKLRTFTPTPSPPKHKHHTTVPLRPDAARGQAHLRDAHQKEELLHRPQQVHRARGLRAGEVGPFHVLYINVMVDRVLFVSVSIYLYLDVWRCRCVPPACRHPFAPYTTTPTAATTYTPILPPPREQKDWGVLPTHQTNQTNQHTDIPYQITLSICN